MSEPFLLYHKIARPPRDARIRGGYTPPRRFARQMAFLKKQGFEFYTASEMIEHLNRHGEFPPNGVALTFDDGWKDNYENAFPVLSELSIKATIFLIPSCIGLTSDKALSEGESGRAHLSREDILEMSRHGIEFGSHTVNHKLLHQTSPEETRFELEESRKQIEELLDKPCRVLAYPGGHFNETSRRLAEETGYLAAFTTCYGSRDQLDLYALNRTEILRRDRFLFQFARKVKPLLGRAA
ncbi:MAG TPA: polysaccharide deacetylase family protein [Pyrinomonadaceae bacterium]|jgi:peptidoglycan/xylan/chitin deacetylase (PgdA/CDA1 family)